jgi:thiamine-phosphate pyrophosphorylase
VLLPRPPLLLVTDRKQAKLPLVDIIEAALAAGCRWISLREKDLSEAAQEAWAARLLPTARRAGACITLHGEATLAQKCGLDGVHLPAGRDAASARCVLGSNKLVGISIHRADEARAVDPALVDYAIAGPVFETASKPDYGPALGEHGLIEIARACPVPVLGIGGLDPARVSHALASGASGIAVMGGVMRAADPGAEIKALLASWNE